MEQHTATMDPKANFRVVILQTELERWKFLVRSFLRSRIAKVGLFHYLKLCAIVVGLLFFSCCDV